MSLCESILLKVGFLVYIRAQLERARQAKKDAEREKHELAERLHKYEQDTKKAEEGNEKTVECMVRVNVFASE